MEQKLISIIVPVYNVEKFVDECIASIVSQTYRNLEIILVDDGSTDSGGKKCDAWAERDGRIRVIHRKNEGVSEARNLGIREASGEYLGFVDSDDVLHPQMYEKLYGAICETGCKISCCGAKKAEVFKETDFAPVKEEEIKVYTCKEVMGELIRDGESYVTIWNKLYAREVIGTTVFPPGKRHEDEFWTYRILSRAETIAMLGGQYYGYRKNTGSFMHRKFSKENLALLEARAERLCFIEENFPSLIHEERCVFRFECIRDMQFCLLYMEGQEFAEVKKRILDDVKAHPLKRRDYRGLPFGRQVWCFLSNRSFMGTCKLRNRFHFGP